jgi:hypothetical protein
MADIIEVILADHKRMRRMLGALDDAAADLAAAAEG